MLSFAPTVDRLTRFGLASHDLRDSFLGEEGLTCEPLLSVKGRVLLGSLGEGVEGRREAVQKRHARATCHSLPLDSNSLVDLQSAKLLLLSRGQATYGVDLIRWLA